jgi:hypothetical protein
MFISPVHVTDFPVVNVHVDELSSARIWQPKLCATYSASVNINNTQEQEKGLEFMKIYTLADTFVKLYPELK